MKKLGNLVKRIILSLIIVNYILIPAECAEVEISPHYFYKPDIIYVEVKNNAPKRTAEVFLSGRDEFFRTEIVFPYSKKVTLPAFTKFNFFIYLSPLCKFNELPSLKRRIYIKTENKTFFKEIPEMKKIPQGLIIGESPDMKKIDGLEIKGNPPRIITAINPEYKYLPDSFIGYRHFEFVVIDKDGWKNINEYQKNAIINYVISAGNLIFYNFLPEVFNFTNFKKITNNYYLYNYGEGNIYHIKETKGFCWERFFIKEAPKNFMVEMENELKKFEYSNLYNKFLLTKHEFKLPNPWIIFCILTFYIIVIAPLNYLILKKIKREKFGWITIPLIVILFSISIYIYGSSIRGKEIILRELSIHKLFHDIEKEVVDNFFIIYSPRKDMFSLNIIPKECVLSGLKPHLLMFFPRKDIKIIEDDELKVALNINKWSIKGFHKSNILNLKEKYFAKYSRESIKIKNTLDYKIEDMHFYYNGSFYYLGDIDTGESKEFSVPNKAQIKFKHNKELKKYILKKMKDIAKVCIIGFKEAKPEAVIIENKKYEEEGLKIVIIHPEFEK